ncbi:hypothetical protein [Litoreibacter albidus]|uniref:DUF4410 domain-containing protein n=1 Tax=Litoreibacter albidus TaxID=670155 RepID=A0A1H2ULB1_9RHOB|nr:hypothetical protein [Litoreibacter albidus]SDW56850.1 hypothetical protein SAMN04488001_1210 [Litoreibacter albidus]
MRAILTALFAATFLSACAVPNPDTDEQVPLGDFKLDLNVAVTDQAKKMGVTRAATAEEWEQVLEAAIDKRFRRYDGEKLYHISYSLDGYILATKGGRLALAPRSALSMTVHIWDSETKTILKDRSKQILVLEQLDGETFVGSGFFNTKEQQMENLGAQFAKAVERWLVANGDLFGLDVDADAKDASAKDDLAALAAQAKADAAAGSSATTATPAKPAVN